MVNLVRRPSVRVYCEIGFNGGHSAAAMLLANPGLLVHSFDLMAWRYSNRSQDLLKTMFGPRLTMHPGDSTLTVPAWTRRNPRECDVLFVDGDHGQNGARKDMVNMMWAAAPGAFAITYSAPRSNTPSALICAYNRPSRKPRSATDNLSVGQQRINA